MPSGRIHLRIDLLGWGLCAAGATLLGARSTTDGESATALLLSYLFSSLFLSPDLDLRYSRAAKRRGWARFPTVPGPILAAAVGPYLPNQLHPATDRMPTRWRRRL